jgi:hypothetical protein
MQRKNLYLTGWKPSTWSVSKLLGLEFDTGSGPNEGGRSDNNDDGLSTVDIVFL